MYKIPTDKEIREAEAYTKKVNEFFQSEEGREWREILEADNELNRREEQRRREYQEPELFFPGDKERWK